MAVSYGHPPGVPELTPVTTSSNVTGYAFGGVNEHGIGVLYVDFGGPIVYAYHGVEVATFNGFHMAKSMGSYLHKHIKAPLHRVVKHEKPVVES